MYNILYCILQGSGVSPPWLLTPWGLQNNRALLCTLASAYIAIIAFLSSSWHLIKGGKASKKVNERTMGRISLAVLYSRRMEMMRCQSPRVGMLWFEILQLPCRVPPRVGTPCAYLSWFVSTVELHRLPRKPRGEPCVHGTIRGLVDI
jgi:hypothetical protein